MHDYSKRSYDPFSYCVLIRTEASAIAAEKACMTLPFTGKVCWDKEQNDGSQRNFISITRNYFIIWLCCGLLINCLVQFGLSSTNQLPFGKFSTVSVIFESLPSIGNFETKKYGSVIHDRKTKYFAIMYHSNTNTNSSNLRHGRG